MNKLRAVVIALSAVSVVWSQAGLAQEGPQSGPVEFFACDWQDGKGPKDLDKLGKQFNKWADKNDVGYSAWVATPQFATDLDYDFLWIGSWPNGASMGAGTDAWLGGAVSGDIGDAFGEVMDCTGGHVLMTSVAVNARDWKPASGNVWFSACSLADGKTGMDALEAHGKASKAMGEMGIKSASWAMFPALGMSNMDYDYLQVVMHENYKHLGDNYDKYYLGGGVQKASAIIKGVTSCKSPNLFDARLIRAGAVN